MNTSYLGNPNLKKKNVPLSWTQDEISEYIKCKESPSYFIRNYVRIVHVDKGLIPFDLYDFQENMVDQFYDNRFVICKMPRQTGKSTTIIAFLLHYILFNEDVRVAILANKGSTARELLSRLQLAYEHLPVWLQQGIVTWNKGDMELENGSKILASATSSSAIRGGSFNIIFLDEFAFVPPNIADEFFRAVYPTISSGETTKVFIVSTPNGMNMFYKMWINAVEGRSDYYPIDVHWSQVPGRDEKWKDQTIRNTSEDQFRVEFETEFIGSSNTLISPSKLRSLAFRDPLITKDGYSVWEHPKPNRQYFICCDVARGAGKDYSAFTVIDATDAPYKLVATYRNNEISPLIYPDVIYKVATHYNEALLLVESNDIGGQVADTLYYDFEYENMLSATTKGRSGQQLSGGFSKGAYIGVKTTAQVKRIGCSTLKDLIEQEQLLILDFNTISELTSFAVRGKSYSATEGNNDDLVMCLVLFSWTAKQRYFRELLDQELREKIFGDKIKEIEQEMTPFGFIVDHTEDDYFTEGDGTVWKTVTL